MTTESNKHFGRDTHTILTNKPKCPECGSPGDPAAGGDLGMTDGNRGKSNERLRIVIGQMLQPVPIGGIILIDTLAQNIQRSDKRLWITPNRVRNLVREREDVRWVEDGTWMKVRRP